MQLHRKHAVGTQVSQVLKHAVKVVSSHSNYRVSPRNYGRFLVSASLRRFVRRS
jgi:hypothetical protein